MKIPFYKYQGTGNDFVMIDQRQTQYLTRTDQTKIAQLCHRRFGIGADGLILLEQSEAIAAQGFDFEMIYFNADGREGSMCGNGGRCTVAFAHFLGVFERACRFLAVDGAHEARITEGGDWVELRMIEVENIETGNDYFLMNTGSPHYIVFVEDLKDINVYDAGREIRYSNRFRKEGINVNFVESDENIQEGTHIEVATYERGVEDETFSCGTGVTAAAIAQYLQHPKQPTCIDIVTKGGQLQVKFTPPSVTESKFTNVWLCGAATRVFEGTANI